MEQSVAMLLQMSSEAAPSPSSEIPSAASGSGGEPASETLDSDVLYSNSLWFMYVLSRNPADPAPSIKSPAPVRAALPDDFLRVVFLSDCCAVLLVY